MVRGGENVDAWYSEFGAQLQDDAWVSCRCPVCDGGERREVAAGMLLDAAKGTVVFKCFRENKCGRTGMIRLYDNLRKETPASPPEPQAALAEVDMEACFDELFRGTEERVA